MTSKRGFQMPFAWLFAIIVGAFILFLALFFSKTLFDIGTTQTGSEAAKTLDILFNPLQTSVESSRLTLLTTPSRTRIYNDCEADGDFGRQFLSVSQETFGRWPDPGAEISFENKYIFSEKTIEGKRFLVFSKPWFFPYKVADVFLVVSEEQPYCFRNAPDEIQDELEALQETNRFIFFNQCPEESMQVCFGTASRSCEILVQGTCSDPFRCESEYSEGSVEKDGKILTYADFSLLYGAVIADPIIYECQVKRLLKRAGNLADLYLETSQFLTARQCNTNVEAELQQLSSIAKNSRGSTTLVTLQSTVQQLKERNDDALCQLW